MVRPAETVDEPDMGQLLARAGAGGGGSVGASTDLDCDDSWNLGNTCQSIRYGERLLEADATASVGSVADGYDNAMAEASTARSRLSRSSTKDWRDADQVERAVVQWVDGTTPSVFTQPSTTSRPRNSRPGAAPGDHEHRLKPQKPDATKLGTAQ
ncbi:hypothetical protein [Streptomyces sanglieri]|uniref:hypothetical protein n=1 Tax=Streptomyces sanglieri TaxID=193460 RepID=UPI00352678AE